MPDTGKLLLAAIVGGSIGFEREAHGQAAGFRTYIIVCVGSCLMMLLSLHIEELYRQLSDQSTVRLDPGRIASYAIASMGFLGAGAIIKGKGSVRGLTTAAGLWVVTGIGLSIGAGQLATRVHPRAIMVMNEAGVNISGQHSKEIDRGLLRQMDIVITLCGNAEATCPETPSAIIRLHGPINDPVGTVGSEDEILRAFRTARDKIKERMENFISEVTNMNQV